MATEQIDLRGRKLAGRYELEEEVASGGMGALWRARDEVLGRIVAVKVLHDHLARNPGILDRFRLEAVAAARLSHPNVVRVFDTGVDDGVCFIVMELVDGRTLADLLADRGPLPPPEAAAVMRAVVLGLAHAHREGVVHRDIKPANVLIDRSGLVKVTDFGIAKAAFAGDDLTTTGSLLGTARYLAPEQVTGAPVDGRTDVYAAGIVLYEVLTGRTPFEGETHVATATMRLTKDPVPPSALRHGIPRALDAVAMRALARDAEDRFHSAEEMASALDRSGPATTDLSPPAPRSAPSAPPARRSGTFRSWMAVPVVLLILAALAVGAYLFLEGLPGGGNGGPDVGDAGETGRLRIVGATSYDPLGDGSEHEDTARDAVDGDEATAWTTEGYTTADLGGAKEAVGLVVELRDEAAIGAIRIGTELPGWRFELYAGDSPEGLESGDPLVAGGETSFRADDETALEIEPADGRYLLIWITELVSADGYRALVNEVEIHGPDG